MTVIKEIIDVDSSENLDVVDITSKVGDTIARAGALDGIVVVSVAGSTASITTIEYEGGLIQDLRRAIERLVPREIGYEHDARWGDGNGYSHVRASLVGPSLSLPVSDGRIVLGTWQQIVLLDFDNRARSREVRIQFVGTLDGHPTK